MEKIFQVSEFLEFLDIYISREEVVVEGEISEIHVSQNKWLFLIIKDKLSNLEVFAVAFQITNLKDLSVGMMVKIYGKPRIHQKSGRFRLHASFITPAGVGNLKIAFEKLKQKLEIEGYFGRKRKITPYPENIGLVTAKNSKAYSDFIKVLNGRFKGLNIYFFPVSVQGVSSIPSLINSLYYINLNYSFLDLIVVTRGGGSLDDLSAFNNEEVAKAIFSSKIPVVSAVGHEEDWTIADMVADFRASTPSNAAELIVREKAEIKKDINMNYLTMKNNMEKLIFSYKKQNTRNISQIESYLFRKMSKLQEKILYLKEILLNFYQNINRDIDVVSKIPPHLYILLYQSFKDNKFWYNRLINELDILNYQNTLNRGFSITRNKTGRIIKNKNLLSAGEIIKTQLSRGNIISKIQ